MIRDNIAKGLFELEFVSTDVNIADIETKALDKFKHIVFTKMLLQYMEWWVHEPES